MDKKKVEELAGVRPEDLPQELKLVEIDGKIQLKPAKGLFDKPKQS